jgi:hypothetical protein
MQLRQRGPAVTVSRRLQRGAWWSYHTPALMYAPENLALGSRPLSLFFRSLSLSVPTLGHEVGMPSRRAACSVTRGTPTWAASRPVVGSVNAAHAHTRRAEERLVCAQSQRIQAGVREAVSGAPCGKTRTAPARGLTAATSPVSLVSGSPLARHAPTACTSGMHRQGWRGAHADAGSEARGGAAEMV